MLAVVLDGIVLVLLLVALGFGSAIWQTFRRLRHGDEAMERLIRGLDAATARAEVALRELRHTADATSQGLADDLGRLQQLADDLRFLGDRGNQVADRLEEQIRRTRGSPAQQQTASPPPEDAPAKRRIGAEELERTLRNLR